MTRKSQPTFLWQRLAAAGMTIAAWVYILAHANIGKRSNP